MARASDITTGPSVKQCDLHSSVPVHLIAGFCNRSSHVTFHLKMTARDTDVTRNLCNKLEHPQACTRRQMDKVQRAVQDHLVTSVNK